MTALSTIDETTVAQNDADAPADLARACNGTYFGKLEISRPAIVAGIVIAADTPKPAAMAATSSSQYSAERNAAQNDIGLSSGSVMGSRASRHRLLVKASIADRGAQNSLSC